MLPEILPVKLYNTGCHTSVLKPNCLNSIHSNTSRTAGKPNERKPKWVCCQLLQLYDVDYAFTLKVLASVVTQWLENSKFSVFEGRVFFVVGLVFLLWGLFDYFLAVHVSRPILAMERFNMNPKYLKPDENELLSMNTSVLGKKVLRSTQQ